MNFKEINISQLENDKNVFDLFKDGAIALSKDDKEISGLTIGWGSFGILWSKPTVTIYINEIRYSRHIFDNCEYFSVCFFDKEYDDKLSYFGRVSGRDENKILNSGLTVEYDYAPYFKESNLVIVLKKMGQSKFDIEKISEDRIVKWYKRDGVHTIYQGEIIKILKKEA